MAWGPFRRDAAARLRLLIEASRKDLGRPELRWFVSQQEPVTGDSVEEIDVVADVEKLAAADPWLVHIRAFGLPGREEALVLTTKGVVELGSVLARSVIETARSGR